MARLERDGLVRGDDVPEDTRNKRVYALTTDGFAELEGWADRDSPAVKLKDEFFMKLVLATKTGFGDPTAMVERRRRECLRALRALGDLQASSDGALEPAAGL